MTSTPIRVPQSFYTDRHPYYEHVRAIRQAVLITEFGIPEDQEVLGDATATHYLIASGRRHDPDGTWYGTARATTDARQQHVSIERLALLKSFRGQGLGAKLLGWIVDEQATRAPGYSMSLTVPEAYRDDYETLDFTADESQPFSVGDEKYIRLVRPG